MLLTSIPLNVLCSVEARDCTFTSYPRSIFSMGNITVPRTPIVSFPSDKQALVLRCHNFFCENWWITHDQSAISAEIIFTFITPVEEFMLFKTLLFAFITHGCPIVTSYEPTMHFQLVLIRTFVVNLFIINSIFDFDNVL